MRYVALLRGINVGGNHMVNMARLKTVFASLGCANIQTYLNSGNIIYDSKAPLEASQVDVAFTTEFGFSVPILYKTITEMRSITQAIPLDWVKDENHQCNVAYLFTTVDYPKIIEELPIKPEYIDISYTKGALYWLLTKENYHKSQINKLIGHKLYSQMTIRNINTARKLTTL